MATLTIMNNHHVRQNVAIAPLLEDMRPVRSRSSPAAMDRQTDPRTSTPRTTYHPCPDERYNWPAGCGDGQTRDRYNCRPDREAAAKENYWGLLRERYNI